MNLKTSQNVFGLLPIVTAVGWAGVQFVCFNHNPNAMLGIVGPTFFGGLFGGAVGCGLMLLGFFGLWIKQFPTDPKSQISPTLSLIGWCLFLGLIGAVALGAAGPSTRFFWYATPNLTTKPLPLIVYGAIAGGIGGAVVGLIVGLTKQRGQPR